MKWVGWICCILLLGIMTASNGSANKKLRLQQAYLKTLADRAASEAENVAKTHDSRNATLKEALAAKAKKLAATGTDLAELAARQPALEQRLAELEQQRRDALATAPEPPPDFEPQPAPPVATPPAAIPANQARIAELEREISELRRKLANVTLR